MNKTDHLRVSKYLHHIIEAVERTLAKTTELASGRSVRSTNTSAEQ